MSPTALPDWVQANQRVIRSVPNEMDKSTVVNISPMSLAEHKPTIEPGVFILPKGTYDNPSILVVGASVWWREVDEKQPLLEIPNSSVTVADSIVNDYMNGLMEYEKGISSPGLFWLPGSLTVKEIKEKHKDKLDAALTRQRKWYERLVSLADILWARSNQNPLAINDTMRTAAIELNVDKNKGWMQDFKAIQMSSCPACGAMWNPLYPICSSCKTVVDKVAYEKLGLMQAK